MTAPAIVPTEAAPALRSGARRTGFVVAAACAYVAVSAPLGLAQHYFITQDVVVAAVYSLALAAFSFGWWPRLPAREPPQLGRARLLAGAMLLALLLWAGTYALLGNYPLTRDEHMVVFDAAVFARGEPAAQLAPEWRDYLLALLPAFALEFPGNAAWVSAYMPINALLRALLGQLLDPALMNPLLAAIGAVALFQIARRIFPETSSATLVALLLYLTSAQMIVTAMTTYAMTGHLALNLVWLALFLRGGRLGHGGAMAVGFLATGLHQIVFHPLFVLPFLDLLRRRREWRILLCYVAGYALIGLFWMSYQSLVAHYVGAVPAAGAGAGASAFFTERVLHLLLDRDPQGVQIMAANLIRFVTWQNMALLPLVVAAIPPARAGEGIARPLYIGILLTVFAMFLLLPYQGHGWGYRYLHGLIGSFALLGGYGWRRIKPQGEAPHAFLAVSTAVTLCLALPFLFWQARAFVKPYSDVDKMISRIEADFVIVDTELMDFTIDEVRNDPFLRSRPLRLSSRHLQANDISVLCSRGTVAFVARERMQQLGLGRQDGPASERFRTLRASVAGRTCGRG